MKVLKITVITVAVLLGLLIVVGVFLPHRMSIEESIIIDTPANVPYSQVTNLKNMTKWDPWSGLDTTMETIYDGSLAGAGAKRIWKKKEDGTEIGNMVITEDNPFSFIKANLDFGDQGKASTYYKFDNQGKSKTKVTWGFESDIDIPILGGYLVYLMESKMGKDYVKGLEKLKRLSESIKNKEDVSNKKIDIENVDSQIVICISNKSAQNDPQISQKIAMSYGQLVTNIQVSDMKVTGAPITINTKWGENDYEFDNCIPIQNVKGELSARVFETKTYSGNAIKIEHIGTYAKLGASYDALLAYISQLGLEIVGNPWEVYINNPSETPENKLITHIYFPVQ